VEGSGFEPPVPLAKRGGLSGGTKSPGCAPATSVVALSKQENQDSLLEEEGFEPSVPRNRDNAVRDCPFRFLGTSRRPTFGLETCATSEPRRRGVGMIISLTLGVHPSGAPSCSLTSRDVGAC